MRIIRTMKIIFSMAVALITFPIALVFDAMKMDSAAIYFGEVTVNWLKWGRGT